MTECISCRKQSHDPGEFIITVAGPLCDGCHRARVLYQADVVIRDARELDDFRQQHLGKPVVSVALCVVWFVPVLLTWIDSALGERLMVLGSISRQGLLDGEVHRLLSASFLHLGFEHWLSNSLAMIYVGYLGERFLGRGWFLSAFLTAGLASAGGSALFNAEVSSIGASGGIYGLFACIFVEALQAKARRPIKIFRKLFFVLVIYMLLNDALVYAMEGIWGSRHVDHAGHMVGLAAGAIFGFIMPMHKPTPTPDPRPGR